MNSDRFYILVMLNNKSCSPCYSFENKNSYKEKLSLDNLKILFDWALTSTTLPEIHLVLDKPSGFEESFLSFLQPMSEYLVLPFMCLEEQENLGIPYSHKQTIVASGVSELVRLHDDIRGRNIILHLKEDDLITFADDLLENRTYIKNILLRFPVNNLSERSLCLYKQGVIKLGLRQIMTSVEGASASFQIRNLRSIISQSDDICCQAGSNFIVLAPDGNLYPCMEFYYAGKNYSMGSIKNIANVIGNRKYAIASCDRCGSDKCEACNFLITNNKSAVCRISRAEEDAICEIYKNVAGSGYLFDCLRTIKTNAIAKRSSSEIPEGQLVGHQVYGVSKNNLASALKDIEQFILSRQGKDYFGFSCEEIMNHWVPEAEVPTESHKSILRRRMQELLSMLASD
jgi:radical SAM protein with 4Fe4S-binding SPASM domain